MFFGSLDLHPLIHHYHQLILILLQKRTVALEFNPVYLLDHYVTSASFDLTHNLVGKACDNRGYLEARFRGEFAPQVIVLQPDQLDYIFLAKNSILVTIDFLEQGPQLEVVVVVAAELVLAGDLGRAQVS